MLFLKLKTKQGPVKVPEVYGKIFSKSGRSARPF